MGNKCLRESLVRDAIDEKVRYAVSPSFERISNGIRSLARVDHGQLTPRVRSVDGRLHRGFGQPRHFASEVFVNDLDYVRAFRDARINECLRLQRVVECRNRYTVPGAMSAFDSDANSGA